MSLAKRVVLSYPTILMLNKHGIKHFNFKNEQKHSKNTKESTKTILNEWKPIEHKKKRRIN